LSILEVRGKRMKMEKNMYRNATISAKFYFFI
jgi:hypothetical protein